MIGQPVPNAFVFQLKKFDSKIKHPTVHNRLILSFLVFLYFAFEQLRPLHCQRDT